MSEMTRRAVLGGAAGGALAGALLPAAAPASAAPASAAHPDRGCGDSDGWLHDAVDWPAFLAGADLIWKRMPAAWFEGPFLGNGFLGSGIYAQPGANAVRFNVQHSQVQDHRPEFGALFGLARLPIGYLTLEPVGAITAVDWRLSVWNAELTGTVTTAAGSLALRAFVHSTRSVLVVEVTPTDGEAAFRWTFHPAVAISPRADPVWKKPPPDGYAANPAPTVQQHGDIQVIDQPLTAGGGHATAWREVTRGRTRTLYAAVGWDFPADTAQRRAISRISEPLPAHRLARSHRDWWHDYYRHHFVSIPDQRLQAFYWLQLYKVASAARRNAPVMATFGPWTEPTPWPATWWNLNAQLEYWLIHGSNHLELDAITRSLDEFRDNLVSNVAAQYRMDSAGVPRTADMTLNNGAGPGSVGNAGFPVGIPGQDPPVPEVGDLTWALHNVWLSYRHTMDTRILRHVVYPLLTRTINYYRHFLFPGTDGRLHLPPTFSPEYGVDAPDTNYDLALIRWGTKTLLDSAKLLRIDDPLIPAWQQIHDTLTPYPMDANGFMIGAGVPFAKSHRHYSHMLMVYPLYEVTYEQPENRALIDTSLKHWISFVGALQGYSYTGAASISAQALRGDDAAFYVNELLRLFILPNTMYKESGPVIETPLSAAQSLHDMLNQSWGGVVRVFPAVPAAWPDVTVHNFRTQGAFLVSASRKAGATQWIRVASEAGARCVVRTGITGELTVALRTGREPHWKQLPGGDVEIDLRRGQEALILPKGSRPDLTVAPVPVAIPGPPWGLP